MFEKYTYFSYVSNLKKISIQLCGFAPSHNELMLTTPVPGPISFLSRFLLATKPQNCIDFFTSHT